MSCQCVRCGTCKGFGSIHDPFDYSGYPDERCMDCDGSGLTEECDECMEAREAECLLALLPSHSTEPKR